MPKHYGLAVFLTAAALHAQVDFNREVRPVLSENCFQCHGPDDKRRMAGVRFDTREGAFAETKRGALIVAGNPDKSLLFQRLTHAEPARRMPPPASDRTVTPKQIETIRRWIAEGAQWQTHWAFVAPKQLQLPTGAANPVDAFIEAKLAKEGLKPNPEADRRTLLRRLSFDLTGLPPTVEEVEQFVRDKSPDAWGRQVDRLMASRHYGERMAMDWLDVARYADTHGYHIDSHRDMWPWRDWLIGAYNSNMRFDRFVRLQLAGDLMPEAGLEGKIASGFNRNHMINYEGGAIPEEYLAEYVADRAETTSTAFMGLTMGCARCHTHKYDPLSHKEYYQFTAFFNNVAEEGLDGKQGNAKPFLKLPTPGQATAFTNLEARVRMNEAALQTVDVTGPFDDWRASLAGKAAVSDRTGLVAHYDFDGSLADSSGGYQNGRTLAGDPTFGSGRVSRAVSFDSQTLVTLGSRSGSFGQNQPFTVAFWMRTPGTKQPMPILQKIDSGAARRGWEIWLTDSTLVGIQKRASRLSVRLTSQWPEKALEIHTRERLVQNEWVHVAVVGDGRDIRVFLNGVAGETDTAKNTLDGSVENSAELRIGANEPDAKAFGGTLDDLRFYSRALPPTELRYLAIDYPVYATLSGVGGKLTRDEENRLKDHYLRYVAEPYFRDMYADLRSGREELQKLDKQILTTMVMSEREKKPRETFILARGDYRNKGEKVEPATPAVLPPMPAGEGQRTRLDLANWLVDPSHPLTARVAVNRYWQLFFGTGLVKTSENFGSQGEQPSHPELLDWLAAEFVRSGWDVKAIQRVILTSAAYRRSSKTNPRLQEKDPENRLLARGPRFRLPAELIRDNALKVSGLLNDKSGGPGVYPYQPPNVWEEIAYGDGFSSQSYEQSHGPDLYRRSMYTFWKRTAAPAQMVTFDAPDREKCTARRLTTNTPLQAFVLLNDPTYVEAARVLAARTLGEMPRNAKKRAARIFAAVTARPPSPSEATELSRLASEQLAYYRRNLKEAEQLLTKGESPVPPSVSPAELAAWTIVASTVLNLDETITKE